MNSSQICLVGVAGTFYPQGTLLEQIDLNTLESCPAMVNGEETGNPEENVADTNDPKLFRVEADMLTLEFSHMGDGFGSETGGVEYEVGAIGIHDAFEGCIVPIATYLKARLDDWHKRFPNKLVPNVAHAVLAFRYNVAHYVSQEGEDWDSDIELLGVVNLDAIPFQVVPLEAV